jgi:hypothetical protein
LMQENYGALSRVNPRQDILDEDGNKIGFTGTPKGRRVRDLGIDPRNYVNFARQGGTNFFEYYDKPSYDYYFDTDGNPTQKPEGFDDGLPEGDGIDLDAAAAATGSNIGALAGNIGASAAVGGNLIPTGTDLLAGIPYIQSLSGDQKQTQIGKYPIYYTDGEGTPHTTSPLNDKGKRNDPVLNDKTAIQTSGERLAASRDTFRNAGYTPNEADADRLLGSGPNIFQNFPAKGDQPGYFGRVKNRMDPRKAGSAGRINLQRSAYAGTANALTQMALGVKPKKALESAAKTESVRYGVSVLTGSQAAGNVAALVAKPILKAAKKVACKTGFSKLYSRKARRGEQC